MISVIVCTYNQEKTIARTLEGILCQQCHVPFEIVVGEDCSSDRTLDICQAYQRKYPETVRLLANRTNKGIIDNYFDCLLSCRGEYIADCAGDDYWTDHQKLEKEVKILEQYPEVSLVHTGWQKQLAHDGTIHPSGTQSFTAPITSGKEMLEAILTQTDHPVIHLCTALYRKAVFMKAYQEDEYLFRNKNFGCEDLQLCFTMARKGDIAYIPDITLNYNVGSETISNPSTEKNKFRFVANTTELVLYMTEKYYQRTAVIERFLQKKLHALYMHAFRSHSKDLLDEAGQLAKTWEIDKNKRIRIVERVTRCELSWRLALGIRRLYVSLK